MTDLSPLEATSLFNVKGWVAVVTGGGTGLGLITAQTLCANGVKVYVTGRRLERLKEAETQHASGGSIIALQMDVTDKASIAQGVQYIESREKCVNYLVNNAGVSYANYGPGGQPKGDVRSISAEMMNNQSFDDWHGIFKVNVFSCYFASVAFMPLLVAARDNGYPEAGSICNISSISGLTKNSQNGQFAYNASKAATISLTEQLAHDFKRSDLLIRVNTIAPGYFPSEMTPIGNHKDEDADFFRTNGWNIPFGRSGNARDYAQAVLGFAVNQYCTGSTLLIDGGWLVNSP